MYSCLQTKSCREIYTLFSRKEVHLMVQEMIVFSERTVPCSQNRSVMSQSTTYLLTYLLTYSMEQSPS